MMPQFWRLIAACVIVLGILLALAQCAFADNCRKIEDEQAEAVANGYFVVKEYSGTEAKAFVPIFNRVTPPQVGHVDRDFPYPLGVIDRRPLGFCMFEPWWTTVCSEAARACKTVPDPQKLRVFVRAYRQLKAASNTIRVDGLS